MDARPDPSEPGGVGRAVETGERIPSTTDPRARALQRLQRSRDQLVDRWVGRQAPRRGAAPGSARTGRPLSDAWDSLTQGPVGLLARQALEGWWRDSPWRMAGEAVALEWQRSVGPWVRRHPVLSAGAVLLAGAGLAKLQPWTWPGVRTQTRRGLRVAGRGLKMQLSREPWRSVWMAGLAAWLAPSAARSGQAANDAATSPESSAASVEASVPGESHAS